MIQDAEMRVRTATGAASKEAAPFFVESNGNVFRMTGYNSFSRACHGTCSNGFTKNLISVKLSLRRFRTVFWLLWFSDLPLPRPDKEKYMKVPNPLIIITILFVLLAIVFLIATFAGLKKRKFAGAAMKFILALFMLSLAALSGTIIISIQGYHALTREELAAVVKIEPSGEQKFSARFSFTDGREQVFSLSGDQLYVDAHILKWKPIVNILGLHTAYKLDRVTGRYEKVNDETSKVRTVYALSKNEPVDMFDLRRRFEILRPLVDAEYGSATFIGSNSAEELKILVSTTGLLIRKAEKGTL